MMQNTDRSFIGEGTVHGRLFGSQDPFLPFGNCDAFSISYATERKALPNYMGGGGNRNVRERVSDVTASIGLYDITAENIALLTRGTTSVVPTTPVADEALKSKGVSDELIPFNHLPDPKQAITVKSVQGVSLVPGTDYRLTPHGIQVIAGGGVDDAGVKVSYTPLPAKVVQMLNGSDAEWELYIAGLNDAQSGTPFALRCHRVKFGHLSELAVFGQEYLKLTGPLTLLASPQRTLGEISAFCEMQLAS